MDRSAFYAALRANAVLGAALTTTQVANVETILDEAQSRGVPLRYLAYALATARHEVGVAMQPIGENLNYSAKRLTEVWPSRFPSIASAKPYANNPQALANKVYAGRLGNGPEASGDGWRYRGRGYPQVTGEENYAKVSKFVDVDLVKNPDRLMEPRLAAAVMFEAMKHGTFTGKKFADYLNGEPPRWREARAIINADTAANGMKVAGHAEKFASALRAAGYIGQAPAKPIVVPPKPVIPGAPEPVQKPVVTVPPPSGEVERNPIWRAFLALLSALFGRK